MRVLPHLKGFNRRFFVGQPLPSTVRVAAIIPNNQEEAAQHLR
jgi:hypothetical protein